MASTWAQIVNDVLTLLGMLSPGDDPAPEDQDVVLRFANSLLENWNTQGLDVFQYINFVASLSSGVGSYTMGSGATWNTPRPAKIAFANVLFAGVNHPLKIVGVDEWAAREEPGLQAQRPKILYNDNGFPNVAVNLHPLPSCTVATSIDLYYWEPLGDAFGLNDQFSFPPGYQKAITYNTAVDCQDIFGRQLSQATLSIAASSKAEIQGLRLSNNFGMENPPPPQVAQSAQAQEAAQR